MQLPIFVWRSQPGVQPSKVVATARYVDGRILCEDPQIEKWLTRGIELLTEHSGAPNTDAEHIELHRTLLAMRSNKTHQLTHTPDWDDGAPR